MLWLCDSEIVAGAEEVSLSLTPPTHRQHPGLSDQHSGPEPYTHFMDEGHIIIE